MKVYEADSIDVAFDGRWVQKDFPDIKGCIDLCEDLIAEGLRKGVLVEPLPELNIQPKSLTVTGEAICKLSDLEFWEIYHKALFSVLVETTYGTG